MIYDTILWYYVWWYLTEYMDWIWEVQNSDSLTAGGSAKIGVKLTREAMEARDLVKTLQKLHSRWPWCFPKKQNLFLKLGSIFNFPGPACWLSLSDLMVDILRDFSKKWLRWPWLKQSYGAHRDLSFWFVVYISLIRKKAPRSVQCTPCTTPRWATVCVPWIFGVFSL